MHYMNLIVKPTKKLQGTVTMPPSKSQTIRALVLASLAKGISKIENPLVAEDTLTALKAVKKFGVKVKRGNDRVWEVRGGLKTPKGVVDTGDSGLVSRFLLPMAGLVKGEVVFNCSKQMQARQIKPLLESLKNLGLEVKTSGKNTWPIKISGKLKGGKTEVSGFTSQYLSSLLLCCPFAKENTEIIVKNLNEKPYIEMTLDWLKKLGLKHQQKGLNKFTIKGGQKIKGFKTRISGDFSAASSILAAAVLTDSKVLIRGLDMKEKQGDKRLVEVLKSMGANIRIGPSTGSGSSRDQRLEISGGKILKGRKINLNDMPDVLPALAVVATQAKGKTVLLNVPQAVFKETNRLKSMAQELKKMGAKIKVTVRPRAHGREESSGLEISQSKLKGAKVHGWHDHRTIMALSVAGLIAEGETVIDTAESVKKTFPGFIKTMKSLGANMHQK